MRDCESPEAEPPELTSALYEQRRVIIDVTDFVDYMVKSRAVSGIQRVISAIADQSHDPEQVVFAVWSMGAFRQIPCKPGARPIDNIYAYIEWKRAIRTIRTRRSSIAQRIRQIQPAVWGWRALRFRPVKFNATDIFFIFGAVWNKKKFLKRLAAEKLASCFQIGVFIHDAIPIFGDEFVSFSAYRNFREYLEWIDVWADEVICNSNYSKQDLVRTKIVAKAGDAKVILLAHEFCYDGNKDERLSRQLARSFIADQCDRFKTDGFILCVGTIEARKNQALLVRAWTELSRERRMPVLILAGKLMHNADPIRIMIERDTPPVAIIEKANDAMLSLFYQDCRFTIFPSLYEGWGLPVGESLWFGKRCLASSASSVPEVGGEHPVYFDPHSLGDLKEKIQALLDEQGTPPAPSRVHLRRWGQVADELMTTLRSASRPFMTSGLQ